jgi:hypothetical protein
MYKIITALAICMIAIGCEKKNLEGDCNPVIPSIREYIFEKQGGSIEITTNHQAWWIEEGIRFSPQVDEIEIIRKEDEGNNGEVLEMKSDWFEIKKETGRKLSVKLEPNQTGNNRWITLMLQAGNCFTAIHISQYNE